MPKISIIIPTYSQAGFLKQCLQSVIDQTVSDWEVIIVNNFSTDNTLDVIQSFRDERIKSINYLNKGVIAASRNEGMRYAKSDLIAFLDSDDWWEENKLASVLNYFDHHADVDLVCHDEWLFKEGKKIKVLKYGAQSNYRDLLFKGNALSTSAVTLKKEVFDAIDGFSEDPQLAGVEDYDCWLRLAKNNCRMKFIHEPLGYFRDHDESFSSKIEKHCAHHLYLFEQHFKDWQPKTLYYCFLMRKRLGGVYRMSGRQLMRDRKSRVIGKQYLWKAMRMNPFSLKTLVCCFLSLF